MATRSADKTQLPALNKQVLVQNNYYLEENMKTFFMIFALSMSIATFAQATQKSPQSSNELKVRICGKLIPKEFFRDYRGQKVGGLRRSLNTEISILVADQRESATVCPYSYSATGDVLSYAIVFADPEYWFATIVDNVL